MAIQGTVRFTLAVGQNTITFPKAGLTVIGLQTSANAHLKIPISPSDNAVIFSDHNAVCPAIVKFFHTLQSNQMFITSDQIADVYLYYGTPFPGSKPLTAYKGVFATITPAAAGSGTVTFAFPGKKQATGIMLTSSASYYNVNFNSSVGESIYVYGAPNLEFGVVPIDVPLPDSLTVNYDANAALSGWIVIYYQ